MLRILRKIVGNDVPRGFGADEDVLGRDVYKRQGHGSVGVGVSSSDTKFQKSGRGLAIYVEPDQPR